MLSINEVAQPGIGMTSLEGIKKCPPSSPYRNGAGGHISAHLSVKGDMRASLCLRPSITNSVISKAPITIAITDIVIFWYLLSLIPATVFPYNIRV